MDTTSGDGSGGGGKEGKKTDAAQGDDMNILIDKPVNVITCDGRIIVGILQGFDQAMNLALSHSHERVFSTEEPVSVAQLGVYLVRGDNVAVVGEIDEEADSKVDYEHLKAPPLPTVAH